MCSLFTVLADGVVQVVVALGMPAALTLPVQPCLSNATAEPVLQLDKALPCCAQSWASPSWAHIPAHLCPIPREVPRAGLPWCPVAALLMAGVVGWAHTDP